MKISLGYRLICNKTCATMVISCIKLSHRCTTIIISLILPAGVFFTVNSWWNVTGGKLMKISLGYWLICNKTCAIMFISCLMLSHRWTTVIISLIHSAGVFLSVKIGKNFTGDEMMKISLGYWLICNKTCAIIFISCLKLSHRWTTIIISLIFPVGVFFTVNSW